MKHKLEGFHSHPEELPRAPCLHYTQPAPADIHTGVHSTATAIYDSPVDIRCHMLPTLVCTHTHTHTLVTVAHRDSLTQSISHMDAITLKASNLPHRHIYLQKAGAPQCLSARHTHSRKYTDTTTLYWNFRKGDEADCLRSRFASLKGEERQLFPSQLFLPPTLLH